MPTRPVIKSKTAGEAFVVSISGTSGAGKSSVIDKAAALLSSNCTLHFDDYVTLGQNIAQIRAWVDAGTNLDEIKTPGLADDLRSLRSRMPTAGHRRIEPADFVILEEPFGRARAELSPLIDFAVFIDTPTDVALARRLLREIEAGRRDPASFVGNMEIQLDAYLAAGRDAYLAAGRVVRATADLVLDGMRKPDELAATLVGELLRRA